MKLLLVLAVLLAIVVSAPIPQRPDGYRYGQAPSQRLVRLDVFEDLLCSDCKAFNPSFKRFFETSEVNGVSVSDLIETVVHIFPLPYHHHAFFFAQLVPFVYDLNKNATQVFEFNDWVYSIQSDYLEGGVDKSENQIKQNICSEASNALSFFDNQACLDEFSTHGHDNDARVSWKFAAYSGITGTPAVLLNGVEVDAPMSVSEWEKLLTPYLKSASAIQNLMKA